MSCLILNNLVYNKTADKVGFNLSVDISARALASAQVLLENSVVEIVNSIMDGLYGLYPAPVLETLFDKSIHCIRYSSFMQCVQIVCTVVLLRVCSSINVNFDVIVQFFHVASRAEELSGTTVIITCSNVFLKRTWLT